MNGLLLIHKPKDWTSFDIVAYVRSIVRRLVRTDHEQRGYCHQEHELNNGKCKCKPKVGHTGTLDPAATGLLVVCVGTYTKKVPILTKQDKTYQAVFRLGQTSTTDDQEGEKKVVSTDEPSKNEVKESLFSFLGEIQQVPPQFSAIKTNGVRAYARARKGEKVKLSARTVLVHAISGIVYVYPDVECEVTVGSGTYIRSLARDLGEKLGTGAYMSVLHRTKVGDFSVSNAAKPEELTAESIKKHLLSPEF